MQEMNYIESIIIIIITPVAALLLVKNELKQMD